MYNFDPYSVLLVTASVLQAGSLFDVLCLLCFVQLFWEKRLKGLRSADVSEDALRTLDLPKGLQSKAAWVCFERRLPMAG